MPAPTKRELQLQSKVEKLEKKVVDLKVKLAISTDAVKALKLAAKPVKAVKATPAPKPVAVAKPAPKPVAAPKKK